MKSKNEKIYFWIYILLLFPVFNSAILKNFPFGNILHIAIPLIATMLLFIFSKPKKIPKKGIFRLLAGITFIFILLINNKFLQNGERVGYFLQYISYSPLIIIAQIREIEYKPLLRVITLYGAEHLAATYIAEFFPSIYQKTILKWSCEGISQCMAFRNYKNGLNPGFTTHYTANAVFVSIALFTVFASFLSSKNKKSLIFIILAIIALLLIGKRAHLVIAILCMLIAYIYSSRRTITDKIKRFAAIAIIMMLAIGSYLVAAQYITKLSTTIDRIKQYSSYDEALNGRDELYLLATQMWKESPIIGNGWGSYSVTSNKKFAGRDGFQYIEAHNDYLQALAETGVIGLTLLLLVYIYVFNSAKNKLKSDNLNPLYIFCFQYLIFFMAYGLTGHPLRTVSTYAIALLIICLILFERKIPNEKNQNYRSGNLL